MHGVQSQRLDKTVVPQPKVACISQVQAAWVPRLAARAQSQVGHVSHTLPRSKPLRFFGAQKGTVLDRPCVSRTSRIQATQVTRQVVRALSQMGQKVIQPCQAVTLLVAMNHPKSQEDIVSDRQLVNSFCRRCSLCGQDGMNLLLSSTSGCQHHLLCFMKGPERELACSPLVFSRVILCSVSGPGFTVRVLEPYCRKGLLFFFVSLVFPWFQVLCHISTLRVSSAHSTLTLRTNNAT